MLLNLLVQTQSLLAKEKPIFYVNTLIYRKYLQNVNCESTNCKFFLKSIANSLSRGATPPPKRSTC